TPGNRYEFTGYDVPVGKTCAAPSGATGTVPARGVVGITIDCHDIQVAALYPNHGSAWNDYVRNDGATVFSSSGDDCLSSFEGGGRGPYACIHGGEMRVVEITGRTECDGISASDGLGVFEWVCDDSTGTARVVSLRVKD